MIIEEIKRDENFIKEIRHALHIHPETAYEEKWTSDFVAKKLQSFGITVHKGLAKTGVLGILKSGYSHKSVALRAELDALDIKEQTNLPYKSRNESKMHACGHDGHMAMLLAAAKYLAKHKELFDGTIYFIFQPAEENEGGAKRMIEDGLFETYKIDSIYGLHNWPALEEGKIAISKGAVMASYDNFEIEILAKGSHAAHPEHGVDPILIASHLITALQSIISRDIGALENGILSVTQLHSGSTWNVIPDSAILRGTVRTFKKEIQDIIEERIKTLSDSITKAFRANAKVDYKRLYPATVNNYIETALKSAKEVVGEENIVTNFPPSMGSEDFSFFLQKKRGCYVKLGTKKRDSENFMLHNPKYDFNDNVLTIGASYWVKLAINELKNSSH